MAPVTPAERTRKYRQKKKDDEVYKEKNKKKCSDYQKNLSGNALRRHRRLCNIRLKTFRQRAKDCAANLDPESPGQSCPFSTRQSMGKAVKRVKERLPNSPRKLLFVAEKIAALAGNQLLTSPTFHHAKRGLTQDTKNIIKQFYLQDDISRQQPGMKDVRRVKDKVTGKKRTVINCLLMFNLREVYQLFKEKHPTVKVGLSTFCTLRPIEVRIASCKSQEVCCCPYCENMLFLFKAAPWKEDCHIKQLPDMITVLVCDTNDEGCMKSHCQSCPRSIDTSEILLASMDRDVEEVILKQWKGGLLEIKETTVQELCEEIHVQLFKYLKRVFKYETPKTSIQWAEGQSSRRSGTSAN